LVFWGGLGPDLVCWRLLWVVRGFFSKSIGEGELRVGSLGGGLGLWGVVGGCEGF